MQNNNSDNTSPSPNGNTTNNKNDNNNMNNNNNKNTKINKDNSPTSLILRNVNLIDINILDIKNKLVHIKSPLASMSNDAIMNASHVDFNNNDLISLAGIEIFKYLVHLNLAKNNILPSTLQYIPSITASNITHLNLSQNNLTKIPWNELKKLTNLIDINFDYNNIDDINVNDIMEHAVATLPLKSISLKGNKIKNVNGLQYFSSIDFLDLSENLLSTSFENNGIKLLNDPSLSIQNLSLMKNEVCKSKCYTHTIYEYFPSLKILDGNMIMLNEKERRKRCNQLKRRCGCPIIIKGIRERPKTIVCIPVDDDTKKESLSSPVTVLSPVQIEKKVIVKSPKTEKETQLKCLNELSIEKKKDKVVASTTTMPKKKVIIATSKYKHPATKKSRIPLSKRTKSTPVYKQFVKKGDNNKNKKVEQLRPGKLLNQSFTKLNGFNSNRNGSLPLRLLGRNKRRGNYNKFTRIIQSRRRNMVKQQEYEWNQQQLQMMAMMQQQQINNNEDGKEHEVQHPQPPSSPAPSNNNAKASPRVTKHLQQEQQQQVRV